MDYFNIESTKEQRADLSSLALAYIGDAVYEVMVRTHLAMGGKLTSGGLHRAALDFVAAPAQAMLSERIVSDLSEEEAEVFRRGRNSKPHSVPKGAKRGQYQTATALEALFGWLYLQGRTARLNELFEALIAMPKKEEAACP